MLPYLTINDPLLGQSFHLVNKLHKKLTVQFQAQLQIETRQYQQVIQTYTINPNKYLKDAEPL